MQCPNPIKVGTTLSIEIDRMSNDTPVDLTDVEITSSIMHPQFGTFEFEVEPINLTQGKIKLVMDSYETSGIIPGKYIWDIVFTDPDGTTEIFPKDNSVTFTFVSGATTI